MWENDQHEAIDCTVRTLDLASSVLSLVRGVGISSFTLQKTYEMRRIFQTLTLINRVMKKKKVLNNTVPKMRTLKRYELPKKKQ